MYSLHLSQHVKEVAEEIAAGGLIAVVVVVATISVATVIYAWFFA